MRPLGTLSTLIPALIAKFARCEACTVVYPTVQVAPDFRVEVGDHGRPVKGLRVEIRAYKGSDYRAVSDTDDAGFAIFRNIRPGSYYLSADHDAGMPDAAHIEVKLGGPTNVTARLSWPSIAPIAVRLLKGIIRGPDYRPGQSQPRLSLELLEGISGRLLKSVQTADNGELSFAGVEKPGLYFLGLKPSGLRAWSGEPITGPIAVAIDHRALA